MKIFFQKVKSDANKGVVQTQPNKADAEKMARLEALVQKLRAENEELANLKGFQSGDQV